MSHVPGSKSQDPKVHFEAGMKDFARLDKVRLINIAGTIQYGIIYCILYFIIGITLHITFPAFSKTESLFSTFLWILLQSVVIILITFYVQKFVEALPGIPSFFPQYFDFNKLLTQGWIPYGVSEYKGDMASSLILIGTQFKLLEKISYFTQEFSKQYL